MLPNALRIFCAKHLLRGLTAQHEVVFDISNLDYIQENLCLFSFKLVQKGMDQPASLDLSKTMIDASRIIRGRKMQNLVRFSLKALFSMQKRQILACVYFSALESKSRQNSPI